MAVKIIDRRMASHAGNVSLIGAFHLICTALHSVSFQYFIVSYSLCKKKIEFEIFVCVFLSLETLF